MKKQHNLIEVGVILFSNTYVHNFDWNKKSNEVSKWVLLKLHIICEGQKISEANRLVFYSYKSTNILFWFCPSFIGQNRKNTFSLFLEEMKTLSSTSSWNSQFKIHGLICKWADRKLWYCKKVPLFCWFDSFFGARAEICQILWGFCLEILKLNDL